MSLDFAQVANGKPKAKKEVKPLVVIKKDDATIILKPIEAKAIIDAYLPGAKKITVEALKMKITDDKTKALASEFGVRIKNLIKDVKKAVEDTIDEAKKYVSGNTNAGKAIIDELEKGKRYLADELLKDKQRRDLEERKRQEAINKADEERRKKLKKEAERLNIEIPDVVEVKAKKEKPQTRTDSGLSFSKGKWTYEILNIQEVPRELLIQETDKTSVNQLIKQGVRDKTDDEGNILKPGIPGLRIFFKEDMVFR